MTDARPPAGLTYAPPYDESQELDPSSVEPVASPTVADIRHLEYFERQRARRTLMARVALLSVIFGMLALNVVLAQRNYRALLINVDQARLEQAEVLDRLSAQVEALDARIAALEAEVRAARGEGVAQR